MTSPHSGINTNILLACGIIAGPLFVFMFLVEGAVRPNYNACRQPVSDLAIGEFGSIQITNFIITGLLFLAFTIGLRRTSLALSALWGPFILGVFSVGVIGAGIFTGDQHGRNSSRRAVTSASGVFDRQNHTAPGSSIRFIMPAFSSACLAGVSA
jgi:hypothetical protein